MRCSQFQKIWPYREVLLPEEQRRLQQHLETCPRCQTEEQGWQQVLDDWEPTEPPAISPQTFLHRLHERLADEPGRSHRNLVYTAGIGLLLLALVDAGWWLGTRSVDVPGAEVAKEVPSPRPLPAGTVKLLQETRRDMASQVLKILDQSITTLREVEGGNAWDDEVL